MNADKNQGNERAFANVRPFAEWFLSAFIRANQRQMFFIPSINPPQSSKPHRDLLFDPDPETFERGHALGVVVRTRME